MLREQKSVQKSDPEMKELRARVLALTGTDPDRLKEEQERGITIELGFAHILLPSGTLAGIIDVPGHEIV